jgi:Enolase
MTDLDGTRELTRLGRSAILATSMACGRAAAVSSGLSLYNYLGGINARLLPVPVTDGKAPMPAECFADAITLPADKPLNEPDLAEICLCEYGTLSEIFDAARFAEKEGQCLAVRCPDSFTGDSTAADISVAMDAEYIILNRADASVINRLIRIEEELFDVAEYAGE